MIIEIFYFFYSNLILTLLLTKKKNYYQEYIQQLNIKKKLLNTILIQYKNK
jgi:hypothetical protein